MTQWKYRKPEPSDVRGLCCHCGKNPQKRKSNGKYQTLCSPCEKRKYMTDEARERRKEVDSLKGYKRPYQRCKTDTCVMCGFTSEYPCQFDVDHIDGNHKNNDPLNLQTLCANCHRLKTLLNGEGIYAYHK